MYIGDLVSPQWYSDIEWGFGIVVFIDEYKDIAKVYWQLKQGTTTEYIMDLKVRVHYNG